MCRQKWKQTTGRVGVVVITIASHAIGRGFNPRIRYYSLFLPGTNYYKTNVPKTLIDTKEIERYNMK